MGEAGYDVGIVGASCAGLAAALMLRRHQRSVVVFDGGPPRNAWAQEVHGYLGVPGVSGRDFHRLGCDQAEAVGAEVVGACITIARADGAGFMVACEDGREWRVRRLLLATGVRDVYPDIANFFDFYGRSVFACPHCDAYEVRGQPVAIVGWTEAVLPFALKLTLWTRHVTVVTDGHAPELTADERGQLAAHDIAMLTKTVRCFEGQDGQLTALSFADGSDLPVRAAFFNIAHEFQTGLARQLGCALTEGECIQADEHMRTSVEGVWAAGDVTGKEQLVAVAAAQGVTAAIDIYRSLPLPTGEPTPV
jgi:thioredoxin reductase